MYKHFITTLVLTALLLPGVSVHAGSLTPPGAPSRTMYTLGDVYAKLVNFTASASTPSGSLITPGTVTPTFYSLNTIYDLLADATADLVSQNIRTGITIFGQAGTLYPASTLKTNQTQCWDESGSVITCTSTGQDGALGLGVAQSYTDNANGTVTDNATGLVWQKATASGTYTWELALDYCNTNTAALPGSGWRLPNVRELTSIVNYNVVLPAINTTAFSGTQSNFYWSGSAYVNTPSVAWIVSFYAGDVAGGNKTDGNYVRCVRG